MQATPPAPDPAKDPADAAKPAEGEKKPDRRRRSLRSTSSSPPRAPNSTKALIESVTPLFKELGISQEGAQKLFDFHNDAVKAATEGPANAMNDMRTEWRGEVVKDPTLGNGTDNLKPEVRANIAKAIESVGDAKAITSFKEAMDLTGAGDNPALVAGLNAIGKLLKEGTLVNGGKPSPLGQTKTGEVSRPTPAQAMYPALPSSAQS